MDNASKISAVILTKNEENNIVDCLESLMWCDEIIVIDDNSTDHTVELAKKQKATVYQHELSGDFAAQRNFAMSKAKNEWIFFVDADERVSKPLKAEIQKLLQQDTKDGYFIPRTDYMWGKKLEHGEQGNMKLIRLGKRLKGKWYGTVHEVWKIEGKVGNVKNALMHYPHQTLSEFLTEINWYSTLRAKELYKQGQKAGFFSVLIYPKAKFVYNYFIRLGFLDGMQGFIVAILMSLHSFLVRGKLWQLTNK